MYRLSNVENIFDPDDLNRLKVNGQSPNPKNFDIEYLKNGTR